MAQLDFIRNRLNLARISTTADHKVIGERAGPLLEFEKREIFGFLVKARRDGVGDLLLQISLFHEIFGWIVLDYAGQLLDPTNP